MNSFSKTFDCDSGLEARMQMWTQKIMVKKSFENANKSKNLKEFFKELDFYSASKVKFNEYKYQAEKFGSDLSYFPKNINYLEAQN